MTQRKLSYGFCKKAYISYRTYGDIMDESKLFPHKRNKSMILGLVKKQEKFEKEKKGCHGAFKGYKREIHANNNNNNNGSDDNGN